MSMNDLFAIVMSAISGVACAQTAPHPIHEVTVHNFDGAGPACVVRMPLNKPRCTPEGCTLPAPVDSKLSAIELTYSCGPTSAPTGYENPAPEFQVETLRTKNGHGLFSLIDEVLMPGEDRFRYAHFCLYGKRNNFCGSAKVMRLGDPPNADGTRTLKAFLQKVELQEPSMNPNQMLLDTCAEMKKPVEAGF